MGGALKARLEGSILNPAFISLPSKGKPLHLFLKPKTSKFSKEWGSVPGATPPFKEEAAVGEHSWTRKKPHGGCEEQTGVWDGKKTPFSLGHAHKN